MDKYFSHKNDERDFWKFSISILTLVATFALFSTWQGMLEKPVFMQSIKVKVFFIFTLIPLFLLNILIWKKQNHKIFITLEKRLSKRKFIPFILSAFALISFFILLVGNQGFKPLLERYFVRIFFLLITSLFIAKLLQIATHSSIWSTFSISLLGTALIWQILVLFPYPLNFPFSLNWSETSWYYYASFFFDRKLYGVDIPWPFLDIGRPLLLSLAYLLPRPSLALMRLWQFFLWVGTAFLVTWLLWRRLKPLSKTFSLIFFLWGILWVLLGPVYIHLSLAVALILWGFDSKKLGKTLFWVGIASLWAGILRINWIPVPVILGLTLYLLEKPLSDNETWYPYISRPLIIGIVGLASAITSFLLYLNISGRTDTRIASKFSADFLWDRLFPNATLATGILPGALLVSAGLLGIIYLSWRQLNYHSLRFFLLTTMLAILFIGGSFASTKIGGGDNLHNLDAYLVMLMIWGSYAFTGKIKSEKTEPSPNSRLFRFLLVGVFLTTASWEMLSTPSLSSRNIPLANEELVALNAVVQEADAEGKSVLFIHNRHLLTFDLIDPLPLVTEYELEELTEIAISNDAIRAEEFRDALREKRYGLIVTRIENGVIQDSDRAFAAENNAWVEQIFFRLENQYEKVLILPESGVAVYAPKP